MSLEKQNSLPKSKGGVPEQFLSKETLLFSGRIGFDFIFVEKINADGSRVRVPYIIEINGSNSGFGMKRVPKESVSYLRRLFANIIGYSLADQEDHYERWIQHIKAADHFRELTRDLSKKSEINNKDAVSYYLGQESLYITDKLRKQVRKFAVINPSMLDIMIDNKKYQYHYFAGFSQPRVYVGSTGIKSEMWKKALNDFGTALTIKSATGKWIVRPAKGGRGEHTLIVDDINQDSQIDVETRDKLLKEKIMKLYSENFNEIFIWDDLVITEFLPAMGAEVEEGKYLEKNPASLRLFIDFNVLIGSDDRAKVDISYVDGIQRVSSSTGTDSAAIVNIARGAYSRIPTDYELNSCKQIAVKILDRVIGDYFENVRKISDRLLEDSSESE